MKLDALKGKSIVILGFGTEGQATYNFLRSKWPSKPLSVADKRPLTEFPSQVADILQKDSALLLNAGPDYLDSIATTPFDVIIKTPGIPASLEQIQKARES